MSSLAPTTRMRLRKKAGAESQDPPADSSGATGNSSKNETKRAPTRKGQRKLAVEVKTELVTVTTGRRGKKVMNDNEIDVEEMKAEEGKYEASTSKGRGRGRKRGVVTPVEDLQIVKAALTTEEPMDTMSDPSSDEVRSQVELLPSEAKRGLRGKGQGVTGKGSRGSASQASGKTLSKESSSRGLKEAKPEPEQFLEEDKTVEQSLPTRRSRRTKTTLKEEEENKAEMSNDVEIKVGLAPNNEQKEKNAKGKKALSKSSAAPVNIKTEEEDKTIEQSVPTKRSRRTKTTLKAEKEDKDHMSNDVEMTMDSATNDGQKKKNAKGKKVVSKSSAASADMDDIKTEPVLELTKTDTDNGGNTHHGKCVGAHCSIAGGLWNAVIDAVSIGAKSFALFLRSQRQWQAKPLEDDNAAKFREACNKHGYPPHLILPHGSYLLNCGSPNPATLSKSRDSLVDEMSRCQKLGLTLYNFHPGSTCGDITIEECLNKIGESINMALAKTSGVTAVIENMSRQGHTIGGDFEELQGIIERVNDKSRIGVCLDTCHAFAAGYDLSTETGFQKMMADFERIIGFQYLKGVHLNDSQGLVGCHRDRHENIGKGKIGLEGFRRVMNDPRFDNIPLILETPIEFGYANEIQILNSLVV